MIHTLAKRIATLFYYGKSEQEINVYIYGIEILISGFIGNFLILLISSLMYDFWKGFMFLIIFIAIRMYIGGYHADTYARCNTIFVLLFIVSVKILSYIKKMSLEIYIWIGNLAMVMIIYRYAPSENKNKKISATQKKKCKLIGSLLYSLCMLMSLMVLAIGRYYSNKEMKIVSAEASNYINLILMIIGILFIVGMKKER